jgi:hypothetical protein
MEMKMFVRANLDRVLAAGLALLGAVALIVGWFGVSRSGLAAQQLPYVVSGGIGGIALIVVGCTTWISADLQDEWRRLDALDERLREIGAVQSNGIGEAATTSRPRRSSPAAKGRTKVET